YVESFTADDRGAREREGHRARCRDQRDRRSGRHSVTQVLQDGGEPEDAVQSRDRPGDLFALKQVVQEVTSPATEIAIDEARQMYQQLYGDDVANSIELGDEMEFPKPTEV